MTEHKQEENDNRSFMMNISVKFILILINTCIISVIIGIAFLPILSFRIEIDNYIVTASQLILLLVVLVDVIFNITIRIYIKRNRGMFCSRNSLNKKEKVLAIGLVGGMLVLIACFCFVFSSL
jgi:hypothetical protein